MTFFNKVVCFSNSACFEVNKQVVQDRDSNANGPVLDFLCGPQVMWPRMASVLVDIFSCTQALSSLPLFLFLTFIRVIAMNSIYPLP